MSELAIWNVTNGKPVHFERGQVSLEKHLEEWIEQDPRLVDESLFVVGRQVHVDAGILDLLAIDQTGRWAIIEIKRGNVSRETVSQALDYAACIDSMSSGELEKIVENYLKTQKRTLARFLKQMQLSKSIFDERELVVYVVGTGRTQDLDRVIAFLKKRTTIPFNVVNFDVFENENDERIISRQLTGIDTEQPLKPITSKPERTSKTPSERPEINKLMKMADQNGVGKEFRLIYDAAIAHGLYPRTYANSIMYAPQANKTRVLICAWAKPRQKQFDIFIYTPGFAEFFPISERDAKKVIGSNRRVTMTMSELQEFIKTLNTLFKKINENQ